MVFSPLATKRNCFHLRHPAEFNFKLGYKSEKLNPMTVVALGGSLSIIAKRELPRAYTWARAGINDQRLLFFLACSSRVSNLMAHAH